MATDECGTAETTATVNVVDSTPPAFISQALDHLVECNGTGNQADLIPWLVDHGGAIAQDNGGNITWSNDYTTLNDSCGSSGNATVIFTASDECGNTSTSSALFAIEDQTSPLISLAAQDTIIECGLPNTQAILQSYLNRQGGAQASDLCGNIVWTNDFPVGVDTCHASTNVIVNFTATDECGNSSITNAIVTLMGTSGSVNAQSEIDFKVSPNPAHDQLKITLDKPESLSIDLTLYDVLGHQVLSLQKVASEINVDVSGIAPGMYLIHVKSNKGVYAHKVIIE